METKMKKFTILLCTLFLVSCSNDEAAESEIVDNAGTIERLDPSIQEIVVRLIARGCPDRVAIESDVGLFDVRQASAERNAGRLVYHGSLKGDIRIERHIQTS